MRDPSRLNDEGREKLDPTPVAIPAGFGRPETTEDIVRRLLRSSSMAAAAAAAGKETWEEANDFTIDEEFDPMSEYELEVDSLLGREVSPHEWEKYQPQLREEYLRAERNAIRADERQEEIRALEQAYRQRLADMKRGAGRRRPADAQPEPKAPPAKPQETVDRT